MLPEQTGIRLSVLQQIRALAARYEVHQVILFGSRARGEHKERSDIDLAVRGGDVSGFALAVDEETDTLLRYDVVDLSRPTDATLLENIEKDGVMLYEKV